MTLLDEVRSLEELGIGTLWVADHYAFPPRPSAPVLEAWTTLAALAAGTRRIRPGMMVGNVATGHPAMVAKLATTVTPFPAAVSMSGWVQAKEMNSTASPWRPGGPVA